MTAFRINLTTDLNCGYALSFACTDARTQLVTKVTTVSMNPDRCQSDFISDESHGSLHESDKWYCYVSKYERAAIVYVS